MKKLIYVTVEEFLNNEGKLIEGRQLYFFDNRYPVTTFSILGEYLKENEKTVSHLLSNNSWKSMPFPITTTFVQIFCVPIYE